MIVHLLIFSLLFAYVVGSKCPGGDCKYQCNQGVGSVSAHDFVSVSRPAFQMPCACNDDWNDVFCSQPHVYSKSAAVTPHTPTVCICRKQFDSNLRCEQFLTRCYRRSEPFSGCKCCFMQDEKFCDQVECKEDRPQFQDANTTCVCFSRPSDYPTEICEGYGDDRSSPSNYRLSLLGFSVSAFLLLAIVVVILCFVGLFTMGCLVVSSKRRRHAREERDRVQRERRERIGGAEAEAFLQ